MQKSILTVLLIFVLAGCDDGSEFRCVNFTNSSIRLCLPGTNFAVPDSVWSELSTNYVVMQFPVKEFDETEKYPGEMDLVTITSKKSSLKQQMEIWKKSQKEAHRSLDGDSGFVKWSREGENSTNNIDELLELGDEKLEVFFICWGSSYDAKNHALAGLCNAYVNLFPDVDGANLVATFAVARRDIKTWAIKNHQIDDVLRGHLIIKNSAADIRAKG